MVDCLGVMYVLFANDGLTHGDDGLAHDGLAHDGLAHDGLACDGLGL